MKTADALPGAMLGTAFGYLTGQQGPRKRELPRTHGNTDRAGVFSPRSMNKPTVGLFAPTRYAENLLAREDLGPDNHPSEKIRRLSISCLHLQTGCLTLLGLWRSNAPAAG
jgi:hypothetical protein